MTARVCEIILLRSTTSIASSGGVKTRDQTRETNHGRRLGKHGGNQTTRGTHAEASVDAKAKSNVQARAKEKAEATDLYTM